MVRSLAYWLLASKVLLGRGTRTATKTPSLDHYKTKPVYHYYLADCSDF